MNNHPVLDRFERLLTEMEQALASNNVLEVERLTNEQQLCVSEIRSHAKTDASIKVELKNRMPRIQRLLERNELLLRQGLLVANSMIHAIYGTLSQQHPGETWSRQFRV